MRIERVSCAHPVSAWRVYLRRSEGSIDRSSEERDLSTGVCDLSQDPRGRHHAPGRCRTSRQSLRDSSRADVQHRTGAIIYLLLKSRCRFATLRDAIPDITDRMLTERLQELEQEGIVDRTVIPEAPIRVEYSLTPKGGRWRRRWMPLARGHTSGASPLRTTRRIPSRGKSGRSLYSCSTLCTNETAIDPSPTADATRLMLPLRTSPTAKTPG
ncbi:MAG: winged helix-turn-helix transcriptional regulator [Thermoanaerobaculia bacterium]